MRIVPYSLELAVQTWEKVAGGGSFWGLVEGQSFDAFNASLMRSDVLVDLGFGLGRITHLEEDNSGRVHGIFWSKEVFGKVEELRLLILSLMRSFGLRRMECVVPRKVRSVNRFVEVRLGFKYEGTLGRYYATAGGFEDGNMYSFLGGVYG